MGGLLCAVLLAKEGKKVCVLEKNRQIGGCLQTFSLKKKVFDSCVHYIGGLGEGHTLHRIFRYAGIMDDLPLHELDPQGFDQILFGDESEAYPLATREYFVERLLPHFPKEGDALKAYLKVMSDMAAQFALYNLRKPDGEGKLELFGIELTSILRKLTKNERLIQVLLGNNMLYGAVDGQTPLYTQAMSTDGYLHSAHKVLPGSSSIAKLLWRELQRHGGEIHRYAEVERLVEADGLIQYAQTADGREWHGKQFISAIHPVALFEITDTKGLRPLLRERVKSLPQTPPGLMINLVLKPGAIPYQAHNVYWHPSGEALAKVTLQGIVWPDTQAFFYNEDAAMPGFAESVTILVYAADDAFAAWQASENISGVKYVRDEAYAARKEEYADRLLTRAFTRFPELKDAIVARIIATALTLRDYTGTPDGSLYGPLKDASKPGHSSLSVRTKTSNLFLTGQHINMHGIMGVSVSAIATCAEMLGVEHLLAHINEA